MSALCKVISEKVDWEKKAENPAIVKKWETELRSQGYTCSHLEMAIKLMRKMKAEKRDMSTYLDKFRWEIFVNECKCDCIHCRDRSNEDQNDPDLFYPHQLICLCAPKLVPNRNLFLNKLVTNCHRMIPDKLRRNLISHVAKLESLPPDWHPNTKEQVLDLVHPSLNCYVDGISKLMPGKSMKSFKKPNLFQWLPANVEVYPNKLVRFVSEINGLSSYDHGGLYGVIEEILGMFMPRIQECLDTYMEKRTKSKSKKGSEDGTSDGSEGGEEGSEGGEEHGEEDTSGTKKYQIIVKLANTVLTPEKPEFEGGKWHLEGHAEEHIAVTGIYYYQNENIVDSGLYTRIPITEDLQTDLSYGQDEFTSLPVHYSIPPRREAPSVQHLGAVPTNEHDCLVFPNFVQHKVSDFRLFDKTKPGVRKILLFWVVDPNVKVISTADVEKPDYTLRDAHVYRDLLMYQRSNEVDERNLIYESELSLCEH